MNGQAPIPGEIALLASAFFMSAVAVFIAVVNWMRIGSMHTTLAHIRDLLEASAGVQLRRAFEEMRAEWKRDHDEWQTRLSSLEEWRNDGRGQMLETNQRAIHALDAIRAELQEQRSEIVTAITLELRSRLDADVRRLVRDEFHKLKKEQPKQ